MSWEFQDHLPIYAQLMDTLKRRIVTGRYLPGEKLPSVRELAAEAGINPNTVQRAFSELEREGLIYTQRATGKYVTENEADIKSARASPCQNAGRRFPARHAVSRLQRGRCNRPAAIVQ